MVKEEIPLKGLSPVNLLGANDENLKLLEERLGIRLVVRGDTLILSGDESHVIESKKVMEELIEAARRSGLNRERIEYILGVTVHDEEHVIITPKKKIFPRSEGQRKYIEAIEHALVVFSIGPAGTGKTYLAVAKAVEGLLSRRYGRIILTRPAVEAGESLGYLPGNFKEKVDPYLRPLYDALYDMLPGDRIKRYLDTGVIEIAPLAFMRGRTLNDAFIILDEAQNTTHLQMKMLLTRIGENSKAVVTGDITQIDLPPGTPSGLVEVQRILHGIDEVEFIYLTERDVVRHKLVKKIVQAYERFEGGE
ncbi:hypothetical protein DRQ18_02845 [bacterium]|nr:MAG: hypothetical protein DRQ18_02845 [bacterium]